MPTFSAETIAAALTPPGVKPVRWPWCVDLLHPIAQQIASKKNFHMLPAWGDLYDPVSKKFWEFLNGATHAIYDRGQGADLSSTKLVKVAAPALASTEPYSVWFYCKKVTAGASTFSRPQNHGPAGDQLGIFEFSTNGENPDYWSFARQTNQNIPSASENVVSVGDVLTFAVTSLGNNLRTETFRDGVSTSSATLGCDSISAADFSFGGEVLDDTDAIGLEFYAGFFCHEELTAEEVRWLEQNKFGLITPDPLKVLPFVAPGSEAPTTPTLAVQDAAVVVAMDNIDLAFTPTLVAQDMAVEIAMDNVTLTPVLGLTVDDAVVEVAVDGNLILTGSATPDPAPDADVAMMAYNNDYTYN